ncbi:hypothetical protein [Streptomyces sp. SAS_260]|uniref:hypothetical protein n=1 Tax=Streptomyces sp. SAS_260 TaxID=3412751 RepID=UPI00403D0BE7
MPNPPYPHNLTRAERKHLETFDERDFEVFTHADWARLGESHTQNIRVHWPDGHYTDGIDQHTADLAAMFVWAPDTRIHSHPLRVAKDELTCVTGVMEGTFTRPVLGQPDLLRADRPRLSRRARVGPAAIGATATAPRGWWRLGRGCRPRLPADHRSAAFTSFADRRQKAAEIRGL